MADPTPRAPELSVHSLDLFSANLPPPGQPKPDTRLLTAVDKARRTHQVTPILKEELRAAIMLRRLSSGQGEVTVEETSNTNYELTPEEVVRQERRRAQNRIAAQRCRYKKRQEQDKFLELFTEQNSKRHQLEDEVSALRNEKRRLETMLIHHMLTRACQKSPVTPIQNGGSNPMSPNILTPPADDSNSFYDFFQDSKKVVPDDLQDNMLPEVLVSELPVAETSLLYNLDSKQILADLIQD